MKVAALLRGGMNSLYAAYLASTQGHEIVSLVTMFTSKTETSIFHHSNVHMTKTYARAMDLPIISKCTFDIEEEEIDSLKFLIAPIKRKIDALVSGTVASDYQKSFIDGLCSDLDLKSITPIWQKDPQRLWDDILKSGFEVIITGVAAEGLNDSWLGRTVDFHSLKELKGLGDKYGFNIGVESGSIETVVLNMPMFKKKIKIINVEKKWDGVCGEHILENIELVDKS